MRPPRAQHIRLDALGALRRQATPTFTGMAAPRWSRSAASGWDSNPFRRAPTPLAGEDLPEAQPEPAPSNPWPKPRPVATVPSPPAKPRQPAEQAVTPDPPSTFRRMPTPLAGEVLIDARPVPPPLKPRAATTSASSATRTCEPDGESPKQGPWTYHHGVPTPMQGEALIKPRDESRKRPTPPPEPPKATPLSREEAKQLSLRKPELFEGEDAPIEIPSSLLTDQHNQVADDQFRNDGQWAAPNVPDRRTIRNGKVHLLEVIHIGDLITLPIPAVAIRDSLRCIASYNEGPESGNPPVRNLYVPGAPAIVKMRKRPHFLTPGSKFSNEKASFRYESAFMAMRAMSDICMDDVDVVLTGSYLRSLYAACSDKGFAADRHVAPNLCTLVRNTLVIHGRVEDDAETQKTRAALPDSHFQRGNMFQDNFTEMPEDTFNNTNFFRILQYQLGNLNCVVIVETDAVLPYKRSGDSDGQPPLDSTALSEQVPLDIQPVPAGPDTGKGWRPRLVPAGKFAEHRTWTELKLGTPDFFDLKSQIYFCNNLFAIYGVLARNCFADKDNPERWTKINDLKMHDFRDDRLSTWEQEEQPALRRTVALIHQLRAIARKQGEGKTCMFWRAKHKPFGRGEDQSGEVTDQSAEGAEESADKLGEGTEHLKASDMTIRVKSWHTPVRPIPQELVDHFWTTPGSGTKPQKHQLVRYYNFPLQPWETTDIDDYLCWLKESPEPPSVA